MKTKLPPIIILLCLTQLSYADNFTVDLGPQGLVDSERDLSFDSLAGTALTGQSMTLNLSFGSEFLRVYPTTSPSFDFLLVFQTNVSGFLAFGTGSAFLTDSGGNIATSVFSTGGSASGGTNLPLIGAGIFPLFLDQSGTPRELDTNLDLYGAQFNLTFPVAQGEITGGEITMITSDRDGPDRFFAIGPNAPESAPVPDSGTAACLFTFAFLCLILFSWVLGETSARKNRCCL